VSAARRPVRPKRWLRGGYRVLQPQGQLSLEIRYLLLRFDQLSVALDQFLPQSFDLARQTLDVTFRFLWFRLRRFHLVR
jgi:hypothetical protein